MDDDMIMWSRAGIYANATRWWRTPDSNTKKNHRLDLLGESHGYNGSRF